MANRNVAVKPRILVFRNPIENIIPWQKYISMDFKNTVLRFFPLAADINKLQAYCDRYLNFTGEKPYAPIRVKAAAPYVLLELNDYPKMEIADAGTWLRTRELIFAIPIEVLRLTDPTGILHFQNWGLSICFHLYRQSDIDCYWSRSLWNSKGTGKCAGRACYAIQQPFRGPPVRCLQFTEFFFRPPGKRSDVQTDPLLRSIGSL